MNEWVSQSVSEWVSESVSQWMTHSLTHPLTLLTANITRDSEVYDHNISMRRIRQNRKSQSLILTMSNSVIYLCMHVIKLICACTAICECVRKIRLSFTTFHLLIMITLQQQEHIYGLCVQCCSISIAKSLGYCRLALSHRYEISSLHQIVVLILVIWSWFDTNMRQIHYLNQWYSFPTCIWVTRSRRINSSWCNDAMWRQKSGSACRHQATAWPFNHYLDQALDHLLTEALNHSPAKVIDHTRPKPSTILLPKRSTITNTSHQPFTSQSHRPIYQPRPSCINSPVQGFEHSLTHISNSLALAPSIYCRKVIEHLLQPYSIYQSKASQYDVI